MGIIEDMRTLFSGDWRKKKERQEVIPVFDKPIVSKIEDEIAFDQYLKRVSVYSKLAENTKGSFQELNMWNKIKKEENKELKIAEKIHNFFKNGEARMFWGKLLSSDTFGGRHVSDEKLRNAKKWFSEIDLWFSNDLNVEDSVDDLITTFIDFYNIVTDIWQPTWEEYRELGYLLQEIERVRLEQDLSE